MVASGRTPRRPLAAVQAYLDLQNFGSLPRAGGTFDQPAELLEEMRVVASHVNTARRKRAEEQERALRQRR
jgi:hypothetical protein